MTAPTISELPDLPTFPSGPGLPDQPGVFIPQFLAFLTVLQLWPDELNAFAAYLESLGSSGGSSTGSLRWNVSNSDEDAYTVSSGDIGAHVRFTSDSGVQLILPVDGSHGFSVGDRLRITQDGEGEVAIIPATGVTCNSYRGFKSAGRRAVFEVEFVGDNEWDALGELTAPRILLAGDAQISGTDIVLLADGTGGEMTSGV